MKERDPIGCSRINRWHHSRPNSYLPSMSGGGSATGAGGGASSSHVLGSIIEMALQAAEKTFEQDTDPEFSDMAALWRQGCLDAHSQEIDSGRPGTRNHLS